MRPGRDKPTSKLLRAALITGAALLMGCASPLAPTSTVWGLHYRAVIVPPGALDPMDGREVLGRIEIEADKLSPFMVGHELAHLWLKSNVRPQAVCAVQKASHCNDTEAFADALGMAVWNAGCGLGDVAWPGGQVTGCELPDPKEVKP